MKPQDILSIKDMLPEVLRMLSLRNTCSIVKFDSNDQTPHIGPKNLCRGQVELIKRLLINSNLEAFSKDVKNNTIIRSSTTRVMDGSSIGAINRSYSETSEIQDQKAIVIKEVLNGFMNYACTTLIDTISRKMKFLIYHKENTNK